MIYQEVIPMKVSEEKLEAFIVDNLLDYIAGDNNDAYFMDFLKIVIAKDYMYTLPRFFNLIPDLQKLITLMQEKPINRQTITDLITNVLAKVASGE
jgi:hypothetical protein